MEGGLRRRGREGVSGVSGFEFEFEFEVERWRGGGSWGYVNGWRVEGEWVDGRRARISNLNQSLDFMSYEHYDAMRCDTMQCNDQRRSNE